MIKACLKAKYLPVQRSPIEYFGWFRESFTNCVIQSGAHQTIYQISFGRLTIMSSQALISNKTINSIDFFSTFLKKNIY